MKSLITVLALAGVLLAYAAWMLASDHADCRTAILGAATAVYSDPASSQKRTDAIAAAQKTDACLRNEAIAKAASAVR